MKRQESNLLKKLYREPEFYEDFLKKFGAISLVPDPVRTVASRFGSAASETAGTAAEAAATVLAVSGYAGGKALGDLFSWAKAEPRLSRDILIKALFVSPASIAALRLEVKALAKDVARRAPNESALTQASMVVARLIKKSMIKAGTLGGLVSVPGTIPGVGTVGTIGLMFSSDFFYQIRTQFLLCHGIAMAYQVELEEERLQAVFLSLMGVSSQGRDDPQAAARALRKVIDQTADVYLTMGLNKAFRAFTSKITVKTARRFFRILPLLGIPFGVLANVESTSSFGEKAEMYFKSVSMNGQGPSKKHIQGP
ncbi:magnetosome protein Mad31 [Candidatus Desulfarcum epimagneticum]|uniref:Magnetosome protein Mad31 n=1 Tax=uncultured Desulfobacteraceae bacterium TaxID=218296 RepID=A0A484HI44_9BACT|nr:magnetosome protein Mad31 [uncultured Desulfobacteraceae bacterium]